MTDGQTNRQADKFEQIHFKKDNILITRKIINYYIPVIEWEFSVSVDTMSHPSFVMGFLISYHPRPRFLTLELILVIDSTIPYLWIDHHFRESHAGQSHHEKDEEIEAAHNGQWSLDLLPSHRGTSSHQLVGTEQALTGKEQHSRPQGLKYQRVELSLLVFYITCNDISVIYVTAQMCRRTEEEVVPTVRLQMP